MANKVDIIDVMIACHCEELKIVVHNGFFLLENTKSGERVRLNKTDFEQVKHGNWENNEYGFQCSRCGYDSLYDGFKHPVKSTYCPNCGARLVVGVG